MLSRRGPWIKVHRLVIIGDSANWVNFSGMAVWIGLPDPGKRPFATAWLQSTPRWWSIKESTKPIFATGGPGSREVLKTFNGKVIAVTAASVWLTCLAVAFAAESARRPPALQWTQDLVAAWRTARDEQRPLFLFLTMDGCVHCQRMKQTTLQDVRVQHELKSRFVPVALNVKDEPEFVKVLRVRSFPTLVVIQPNGDVVESISGFQTAKQLREKLESDFRQASHETTEKRSR
jgi:thioredoxin-related protein